VCNWVKRSWEGISDEIIVQSFKTCGISNSLNEDDIDNDKENEEFEIIDVDKEEESIDMRTPQAR